MYQRPVFCRWKNFVTKIKALTGLEKTNGLETLRLANNEIEDLKALEELNLENNKIEDLKALENLDNLKYLNLKGNCIKKSVENDAIVNILRSAVTTFLL